MTQTSTDDERFMALALSLGRRGLGNAWPNPAVGAVIVKDGVIVGRGWTRVHGRPHAEVEALKQAKKAAQGATLYATLEPCSHQGKSPPCADAIIKAGIARVVSALEDPNPEVGGQGHARLRAKGVTVDVGLGADEARRAHAGHIMRIQKARPFVTLKLALSKDEKVGLVGRKPVQLTGEQTRERVFQMRAQHDAILVGIGTVLSDNPHLTCRLPGMMERSPVRVVLDARLRLPLSLSVVSTVSETSTWVFTSHKSSPIAEDILQQKGCKVFRIDEHNGNLDLEAALKILAEQGITRLMVEGGPTVAASFVAADLVDEAVLLRADKTIGADGVNALEGMPLSALTGKMTSRGTEKLGADTLETFEHSLMFTGLVSDVGEIRSVKPRADNLHRVTIFCAYDRAGIAQGASIACSGVCLTVVDIGEEDGRTWFAVDAADETLRVTTVGRWRHGARVNLERSLKLGDELGGHLVAGHVDGIAKVIARDDMTDMARFTLCAPAALSRFIAAKGSVTLDGVSLTVNTVDADTFSVLIIPHTLAVTTFGTLAQGDDVNLEIDTMARYAARLIETR